MSAIGRINCTVGFCSVAIRRNCCTARCCSIWYCFFKRLSPFSWQKKPPVGLLCRRLRVATFYDLPGILPAFAEVQTKAARIGTSTVHYKVVLPNGYDPEIAYPAVLAFGGGPQTMAAIDLTLVRNWQNEAQKRGYIVILPAAPDDILFFQGGD